MAKKEILATIIVGIITILCVVAYLFFDQQGAFVGSIIGAGLGYLGAKVERNTAIRNEKKKKNYSTATMTINPQVNMFD